MAKEEIYDAQINPLMAQILEICKEHKIVMLASFSLHEDGLCCTSMLFHEGEYVPDTFRAADRELMDRPRSPLMITTKDGDGKIVNITAVL